MKAGMYFWLQFWKASTSFVTHYRKS
ncbi:DEBR0S6_08372g1_1 [Brettanomyces bruxellensis]|uniref:DEBR0S6_08372g1_1 n=1 Tax=Dekkera bruxellensis TaxID=5007 RepID=A0A7D9D143_DEKBR|nr:DEBR0S6_08372g1_1 [Brettanomyces bruxellensis]